MEGSQQRGGGVLSADWPQAEKLAELAAHEVGARRRVGRYVAIARSADDFECLYAAVLGAARRVALLHRRLLTFSHTVNAIAVGLKPMRAATRVLVDGFVLEGVARGDIARMVVLSATASPYQLLSAAVQKDSLDRAVESALERLNRAGALDRQSVLPCLPPELRTDSANTGYLLSHLVYRGVATSPDASASTIEVVHAPR